MLHQNVFTGFVSFQYIRGKKYPVEVGFANVNDSNFTKSLVVFFENKPFDNDSYLNTSHGICDNFTFNRGNVSLVDLAQHINNCIKPNDIIFIENDDVQEAFFKSILPETVSIVKSRLNVNNDFVTTFEIVSGMTYPFPIHDTVHYNDEWCCEKIAWFMARLFQYDQGEYLPNNNNNMNRESEKHGEFMDID